MGWTAEGPTVSGLAACQAEAGGREKVCLEPLSVAGGPAASVRRPGPPYLFLLRPPTVAVLLCWLLGCALVGAFNVTGTPCHAYGESGGVGLVARGPWVLCDPRLGLLSVICSGGVTVVCRGVCHFVTQASE